MALLHVIILLCQEEFIVLGNTFVLFLPLFLPVYSLRTCHAIRPLSPSLSRTGPFCFVN